MRRVVLLAWLMIPVFLGAYHYGPGQQRMLLDQVARTLAQAERSAAAEKWANAVEQYSEALELLPAERLHQGRRIRLERAKAQMFVSQLPAAHQELKSLVDEITADSAADPRLLADARAALANARYYLTWLMRLEGEPRDAWEPEIEDARQTFRLLAEQAWAAGDAESAKRHGEDLEATIRLARLDLSELQGLPLPSQ